MFPKCHSLPAHNGFCSRRQHGSHETYPLRRDFQENLSFASGCLNLELLLQLAAFFIIGPYYIGGQAVPVDERAFVLGASLGGYEVSRAQRFWSSSCCMDCQVGLV